MFFFPPDVRVADTDREAVVEFLNQHYSEGRLSDRELSDRVDAAHQARFESQLVRLTDDLPYLPPKSATLDHPRRVRPLVTAAAVAVGIVAILAVVPADAWAPLLALLLPLAIMLVFALGPIALPVLAFAWLARTLGGPRDERRAALPPRRASGGCSLWELVETRWRW